jgi:3',5'-cyclic AMP phosphodiesterase CpdA
MTIKSRIAILSDLHIGEKAREFDMRPQGKPAFPNQVGFLDYFEQVVSSEGLSADILVISGDITDRAQPSQFVHAGKLINRIASKLGVKNDSVVIVPGNHDLNWDVAQLAANNNEPFWLDYRFAPFVAGQIQAGYGATLAEALVKPPHFLLQRNDHADLWSFNSAAYDTPDRKPHYGEIREQHRQALADALQAEYGSKVKEKRRIFITHHHLKPQPDLYPDIPDFSGMVNGDQLYDLILSYNFDLVLHGHKHRPWIRATLESGSFSQQLGSYFDGRIANLWHLVDIHESPPGLPCKGEIKSWAFAPAQGWVPARPIVHGIDHITPFGYVQDRTTISDLMDTALAAAFAHTDYVEWKDVCVLEDALRYQPGPVVWSILSEVCDRLKLRPHGEQGSLDGLIILRNKK